jgi:carbamoyl-phosphate synthase small subunit
MTTSDARSEAVPEQAYLVLEDATVFSGWSFGRRGEATGEIVFTTGMTGYLETLTDPSYHGQVILQTFPLIGNYGVIPDDFESAGVHASGYIVKHPCANPSNFRSLEAIDAYLRRSGVVGLYGIDTRALTRLIRLNGVMRGKITMHPPTAADLAEARAYSIVEAVAAVSAGKAFVSGDGPWRVALLDFGAKRGIASELTARGATVHTLPHDTSPEAVLALRPHGLMLSNGPGDPADPANAHIVATLRVLLDAGLPTFGICLGHQLLALARGLSTVKLKFGHRGANQPVKHLGTGRVYITSQNHGYAVVAGPAAQDAVAFINVNDGTCEGLDFGDAFSV